MDSLNLPIISEVFQFVEQTCPFPTDIVHDQVASYEPLYRFIFERFKSAKAMAVEMRNGRRFHLGFENVVSLSFAESKTEPLIRAADYALAGVRKFIQFALADQPISEDITLIAFYMMGPLVLGAHERLQGALLTMPDLARVMASDDWVAKVFQRLIAELELLARSTPATTSAEAS